MGIKGFYGWLIDRYPLIIKIFSDISRPVINSLYIDFNQLLFHAREMCIDPDDHAMFTNEILRYLDSIVQLVRPTTLIFIAIDGSPPYNKIYNQLQDKNLNLWNNNHAIYNKKTYKQAHYHPGAYFITRFQRTLHEFIRQKTVEDAAWINPQVVYSSVNNPGETEHKIFEFIRKRSELAQYKEGEVHCVFSNDADIIPLIMLTSENNFLLMRTRWPPNKKATPFFLTESNFELVYVNILREYLLRDYFDNSLNITNDANLKLANIFYDWVFLISLAGNDFFRGFSYFSHKNKDGNYVFYGPNFILLMNLYESKILGQNLSLINPETKEINLDTFLILIKAFMDDDQIKEKVDNDNFNDQVSIECEKLLNNFSWILNYYFNKCPSWSYFYSCDLDVRKTKKFTDQFHHLSFSDLYIFITKNGKKYHPKSFEDGSQELTPFDYLLSHYPKMAGYLPSSVLKKVDEFLDKYEKETGSTDLSLIPYDVFKKINRDASPEFTDEEIERNKSTDEFYIIEGGQISSKSFEFVTTKQTPKTLWIPSLNKITNFFQKSKGVRVQPVSYYDIDLYPLKYLKKAIAGRVILIDYPFLKPFIVKTVEMVNPSFVKREGIDISDSDDEILAVTGYPIIISSTNRSSISISSQIETHAYCLTAPLAPKLENILNVFEASDSIIQKGHKVLIINQQYYCQFGIIKKVSHQKEKALITLISKDQPDLTQFIQNKCVIEKKGNSFSFSDDNIDNLERKLMSIYNEKLGDDFDISKYDNGDVITDQEIVFNFDDLIWEGKSIKQEQFINVGNRVVSITHGGPIEFGEIGTVVSYNYKHEELSVVFDRRLKFGCSLRGLLSTTRGIIGKNYDFFVISSNDETDEDFEEDSDDEIQIKKVVKNKFSPKNQPKITPDNIVQSPLRSKKHKK